MKGDNSLEQIRKAKKEGIKALILIVLLIFIGFSSKGHRWVGYIESAAAEILSPLGRGLGNVGNKLSEGAVSVSHVPSLSRENKVYREKVAQLEEENRNLQDIIARSNQLRNENAMRQNYGRKLVKGHVILKSDGMVFNRFTIDRGTKHGVEVGDTVVIAQDTGSGPAVEGLVGKVDSVGRNHAEVVSIIDENNAVSFKTVRSQEGGVVKGKSHRLEGYGYELYSDIVPGDDVLTSGIGDLYDRDIYIGTVSKVTTDENKMVKNILIEPAVNFYRIFTVHVITGAQTNE